MKWTTIDALAEQYDALLFDAYGVLVHGSGPVEGAREALERLGARDTTIFVVTNDCSRSLEQCAARYQQLGLDLRVEQVISSGSLLTPYFADEELQGAHTLVLGPEGSKIEARRAGAVLQKLEPGVDAEVLILGDESGFATLEGLDIALNLVIRKVEAGEHLRMICPNPDVLYPKDEETMGLAVGSLAAMLENALRARLGDRAPSFVRLGKPFSRIYREAIRRAGSQHCCMIGDQLATDVRGALEVGLDAALVSTGVLRLTPGEQPDDPMFDEVQPTWLLHPFTHEA